MLLDGDLGHVLDGVVDLVANMVGNWDRVGSNSWGSNCLDNWGSLNSCSWDNSLDSSNSWGSNSLDNWGSHGMGDNRSSNSMDNRDSLANRINKTVLVEVLGKSLESQRSISIGSGHKVADSWGQRPGG